MVQSSNLISAAKDIAKYVMLTFMVYFTAIIVHIVLGFFSESVIPALGLDVNGTAVLAIDTLITTIGTAITAITGIVTVITGLLTLSIVLKAFNINLNFSMGGGRV